MATKSKRNINVKTHKSITEKIVPDDMASKKKLLSDLNQDIKAAYNEFKNIKNRVVNETVWKGNSADQYDYKFLVIQDRYKERIVPADKYFDFIETAMNDHVNTDNENERLANELKD